MGKKKEKALRNAEINILQDQIKSLQGLVDAQRELIAALEKEHRRLGDIADEYGRRYGGISDQPTYSAEEIVSKFVKSDERTQP